jgi:hypothetical protein
MAINLPEFAWRSTFNVQRLAFGVWRLAGAGRSQDIGNTVTVFDGVIFQGRTVCTHC